MSLRKPRPWYIQDSLCDDYLHVANNGGDLQMLQALKVLRGISLNAIIAAVTLYTVLEGGDPTLLGGVGLVALMVINGVELTDYLAAKQALDEANEVADDE